MEQHEYPRFDDMERRQQAYTDTACMKIGECSVPVSKPNTIDEEAIKGATIAILKSRIGRLIGVRGFTQASDPGPGAAGIVTPPGFV